MVLLNQTCWHVGTKLCFASNVKIDEVDSFEENSLFGPVIILSHTSREAPCFFAPVKDIAIPNILKEIPV